MLWKHHWFSVSIGFIFLFAIALRIWNLAEPTQLVFDEIYYVKYAVAYLTDQPVFDAHPPFAKYLIAIAIWLGETLWFRGEESRVAVEGLAETVLLSPLSFRWLNALVGSTIPLLVAGVALELSGRRSLAFLAGLFAALDGFLLVESRFALLHVYLVAFGLLGQWCFLKAWRESGGWLLNAGLSFGAAVSVKWNGLGYWLVPMGLWLWRRPRRSGLAYLAIAPALFYTVLWLPHLSHQTTAGFFEVHQQIVGFHRGMDAEAAAAHPYCSPWWSWPLMLRPIAYFFEKSGGETGEAVRRSIIALGNPLLWWLTTGAIALLAGALGWTAWRRWLWRLRSGLSRSAAAELEFEGRAKGALLLLGHRDRKIAAYLLLNYAASWLPWIVVKRCTFSYHHLGALCFGIIALAFWCDRGLRPGHGERSPWRWQAWTMVGAIALAFWFWLPLYLGLPLSRLGLQLRLWLPSWT